MQRLPQQQAFLYFSMIYRGCALGVIAEVGETQKVIEP